ncbi:tyrosine--tRNA ligase [Patescibacteria group bacterium]
MNILEDLKYRGLIYQMTDEKELAKRLEKPIILYCGFDPTAKSLHLGNLLQILILKRFQKAGHKPIAIAGGGTGLIGDPSGKVEERKLNTREMVNKNLKGIKKQLSQILGHKIKVVNNYDWFENVNRTRFLKKEAGMSVIDYLRDYGKYFSINEMLAKESVKSRLETGISFTEFNYMVLQSIDFLKLNNKENCELQIGGSDQWGNITAGVDLIRKHDGKKVFGLTVPLITKSDGSKFGKTESGTIWLDSSITSPYEFYQFWINSSDKEVVKLIKYFTFLSHKEIDKLEQEVKNTPEKRIAQKTLAQKVTKLVHGKKELKKVQRISEILFKGEIKKLNEKEIEVAFSGAPVFKNDSQERFLVDLLTESGVCESKRQAREDIEKGAVYLNGQRTNELEKVIKKSEFLFNKYLLIRRGKKNYTLIKW